jgi:hypothetical protein
MGFWDPYDDDENSDRFSYSAMPEISRSIARGFVISWNRLSLFILYGFLIAGLVGAIIILAWPVLILWFSPTLSNIISTYWGRILGLVILGLLSFALYLVRENLRKLYGIAEIVVGLVACWAGFGKLMSETLGGTIALAGGVYIMVRGIDNYVQGAKTEGALRNRLNAGIASAKKELEDAIADDD